uniref:Asteroid homolog 1 n=1 Tax=Cynoglossus semilaevis TaxID=244447 RepID=A0A3P8VDX1_CYNSE
MGVQGLTTYVEANRSFLKDIKFRDSRLVIDGCSLFFHLYFHHCLDRQYGGDYDAFTCLLTQFLSALEACNIQPYVVLDGGIDPSDKKFSTIRQRLQSKIKDADNIAHGRGGSVLPVLTRNVFIQVLRQKGIPFVQCPAEADLEIACLAHHWNCPVLTNDSDFYIFDLPDGYLPLCFFQWTHLNGKVSNRYISARRYTTNALCHWFGGMNPELLPLCAVLNGNDYGAPKDTDTLLALLDVNSLGRSGGKGKGYTSRIEALLFWLSSFSSPAEALEEINRIMGDEVARSRRGQKSGLSSQLWTCMQEYCISPQSSLAHWFSGRRMAPGGETSGLADYPEWISQAAAQGLLSPLVVDALVMRRVLLIPQVENTKLPSSYCSSKAIRQAIYGILHKRKEENVSRCDSGPQSKETGGAVQGQETRPHANTRQGKRGGRRQGGRGRGGGHSTGGRSQGGILPAEQEVTFAGSSSERSAGVARAHDQGSVAPLVCVEEFDRVDLSLKRNQVEARPPRATVYLDTLDQVSAPERLNILLEALEVKESFLTAVPLHLRLAVAGTTIWMRESVPTPSHQQLQALVLGMVYGEVTWNNQPGVTHYHYAVSQINWASECSVWSLLDRQRVRPGDRRGLDIVAAHSFSQWQACLFSALSLNQLLLLPLPEPHLSWLFSGTLVHGLLRYLKSGQPAESLLAGGSLSEQLYSSVMDAVKNNSAKA